MVKAAIDELLQEGLAMRTAYLEAQKEIKK
jgi:hypothetical protein